jgi:hypothetical protein
MHASARQAWQGFITKHEGNIGHMYLDTKGLVTIGIGNLIDPLSLATPLPFQFKIGNRAGAVAGRIATTQEIEAEWRSLKNHPLKIALARRGARSCDPLTNLELTMLERQFLFDRVTNKQEMQLTAYFPDFGKWPGDAQLGVMAMAWGLGMYFPPRFPRFTAACRKQDFDAAAKECTISNWRPERNAASVRFFTNAARVVANPKAYRVEETYYPQVLLDTINVEGSI